MRCNFIYKDNIVKSMSFGYFLRKMYPSNFSAKITTSKYILFPTFTLITVPSTWQILTQFRYLCLNITLMQT